MAKNVYILQNLETNEILCASEDKNLVREILCDLFMDDVLYQWFWELEWCRYDDEELPQLARRVWEDILEWFDENIIIQVAEVI